MRAQIVEELWKVLLLLEPTAGRAVSFPDRRIPGYMRWQEVLKLGKNWAATEEVRGLARVLGGYEPIRCRLGVTTFVGGQSFTWSEESIVEKLVRELLGWRDYRTFGDHMVEWVVDRMCSFFESSSVELMVATELSFKPMSPFPEEGLCLGSGLTIVRDDDLDHYLHWVRLKPGFGSNSVTGDLILREHSPVHFLVQTSSLPIVVNDSVTAAMSESDGRNSAHALVPQAHLALLVGSAAAVGCGDTFTVKDSWPFGWSGGRNLTTNVLSRLGRGELSAKGISEARAMLAWIRSGQRLPELSFRRYVQAGNRESNDDALLDLVIAMEAVLMGGIKTELSYRCALRGAYYLERTDESVRRRIFERLRLAYKFRSQIAHGVRGKDWDKLRRGGRGKDQLAFVTELREYVRLMLGILHSEGPVVDWDELIVGRKEPGC